MLYFESFEKTPKVQFVDYGTVEMVTVEDIRNEEGIVHDWKPIQCFPVRLENIQPITDKWERPVLDFLQTKARIYIADLLMENGYAKN